MRRSGFFTVAMMAMSVACARAQDASQSLPLGQSSCETDVKALQEKRGKLIDEFNRMAKAHDGKLDPIESCPKLKDLASVENTFKNYMIKNKDWCNIPDDAITNVTDSQSKTAALAVKVCTVAVQFKKQQQMQAAGGALPGGGAPAPKLPAGPL
jgi:hypothetical protein